MKKISEELSQIIDKTTDELKKISDIEWNYCSALGKWSKKEILGHLIDSAVNNHQRFVRAQYEDKPSIIYDQEKWVSIQNYNEASSVVLIELWTNLNKHLAFILSVIPEDKHKSLCDIKKEEPVTLEWIAADYIRHLNHHIGQIIK